jgi:hypothetical protein
MSRDRCPKCERSLTDWKSPKIAENPDGSVSQTFPYTLGTIMQYLGVREQHMVDHPDNGGCGWAWSESKDKRTQILVDKWNNKNYPAGNSGTTKGA